MFLLLIFPRKMSIANKNFQNLCKIGSKINTTTKWCLVAHFEATLNFSHGELTCP